MNEQERKRWDKEVRYATIAAEREFGELRALVSVRADAILAADAELAALRARVAELDAEVETLRLGIDYLHGLLRRVHSFVVDDEATHNNAMLDCAQLKRELDAALGGHDADG